MKHRRLKKPFRIITALAGGALAMAIMLQVMLGAILQESYKLTPVTAEEIAEANRK